MKSKITGGDTSLLFKAKILSKYDVSYFICNDTGFIQTEEPYWLGEAYSSAITKLDIGLVIRNMNLAELCEPILIKHFNHEGRFLDYAGGYGLFTNIMRFKGFDFYHTDIYCQNIFAEFHDLADLKDKPGFELTTAFEVFEHLPEPITEIGNMLKYADNLIFSTEIVPANVQKDWWYFSFETGQHISFYTIKSLEFIAKKFNKHFYTNGQNTHIFTGKQLSANPFAVETDENEPYFIKKFRKYVNRYDEPKKLRKKETLLSKDVEEAKKIISRLGSLPDK